MYLCFVDESGDVNPDESKSSDYFMRCSIICHEKSWHNLHKITILAVLFDKKDLRTTKSIKYKSYVRVGGFLLPKLHSLKLVSILVSKGDFMAWSDAKTIIENKLQADNTNSETEVDGHRVRKRSLNELVQLEDLICTKEDEETNGDAPLRTAGFRVQAYNNGSGLI